MLNFFTNPASNMLNFFTNPASNMLKICLSKNTQKSKFHDLTHALRESVGIEYQNEENFEICTF